MGLESRPRTDLSGHRNPVALGRNDLPRLDAHQRLRGTRPCFQAQAPGERAGTGSPDYIAYVAAAARVADALTRDVLLAPIESSVIPLPHQIRALSRAIANDRVRYLLSDEVCLGKII